MLFNKEFGQNEDMYKMVLPCLEIALVTIDESIMLMYPNELWLLYM